MVVFCSAKSVILFARAVGRMISRCGRSDAVIAFIGGDVTPDGAAL
jgi:hypothetical protein